MALYRTISNKFWEDAKVMDQFTPEDKYFYLYLLTNPHTTPSGCYAISYNQMMVETGYNRQTLEHLLDRFENIHNVIRFDRETNEILILNWYKYNWTSPTIMTSTEKQMKEIKSDIFKEYIKQKLYPIDTLSVPYTESNSNSNSKRNSNSKSKEIKEKEKEKKESYRFVPPTLEEISSYCLERNNNVDPDRFYDFYSSKGWMVGKNKMKDWKAAVRTWEKEDREPKLTTQQQRDYAEIERMLGL